MFYRNRISLNISFSPVLSFNMSLTILWLQTATVWCAAAFPVSDNCYLFTSPYTVSTQMQDSLRNESDNTRQKQKGSDRMLIIWENSSMNQPFIYESFPSDKVRGNTACHPDAYILASTSISRLPSSRRHLSGTLQVETSPHLLIKPLTHVCCSSD